MKSRTRQAILEAARKLFSTWGYDGASMDAIAAEARVTKVTVYRHFENKDALFSGALQSLFDELPTPQSVVFQEQGSLPLIPSATTAFDEVLPVPNRRKLSATVEMFLRAYGMASGVH